MLYKTSKEGNKPKTSCNIILLKKINYIQTSKKTQIVNKVLSFTPSCSTDEVVKTMKYI